MQIWLAIANTVNIFVPLLVGAVVPGISHLDDVAWLFGNCGTSVVFFAHRPSTIDVHPISDDNVGIIVIVL